MSKHTPNFTLPVDYTQLTPSVRRAVREQYIEQQGGKCFHCLEPLSGTPPKRILSKSIDWRRFPPNFLAHPVHLQHDHDTGMTEGAAHAYCNAVLWVYYGR